MSDDERAELYAAAFRLEREAARLRATADAGRETTPADRSLPAVETP